MLVLPALLLETWSWGPRMREAFCLTVRAPETVAMGHSGQHDPHQGSGLIRSLWVLLGMQWISNQLPRTWRGCAKLGAPLTHPDFGEVCNVVTIPLACAARNELTRVPYFCRQRSGRTWRKMQFFPMAETNLRSLTAAVKREHYLSLFLAILFLPTRPQGLNHSSPKAKSGAWASSPATPCCHPANNRLGVPHPLPAPAPRSLPASGWLAGQRDAVPSQG